jgi:RsiW-degrading membrane proteinase PrsW (M82 family)
MLTRVVDQLRWVFPYAVAFFLPPSGVILAAFRYSEGERTDALWIVASALLGVVLLYIPLFVL